jgi:hypothetical protein
MIQRVNGWHTKCEWNKGEEWKINSARLWSSKFSNGGAIDRQHPSVMPMIPSCPNKHPWDSSFISLPRIASEGNLMQQITVTDVRFSDCRLVQPAGYSCYNTWLRQNSNLNLRVNTKCLSEFLLTSNWGFSRIAVLLHVRKTCALWKVICLVEYKTSALYVLLLDELCSW